MAAPAASRPWQRARRRRSIPPEVEVAAEGRVGDQAAAVGPQGGMVGDAMGGGVQVVAVHGVELGTSRGAR
ncbi:hypothetical protein CFP59_00636 [Streptomyces malaysiensis subsp. malaysiensis]|nr:hypothetical protein CFP59_00636 [Streptomyces sp. M56]SCF60848.1 hypothetical protein GA0115260_1002433 [Streptomyces sp. MnatMP-M27]